MAKILKVVPASSSEGNSVLRAPRRRGLGPVWAGVATAFVFLAMLVSVMPTPERAKASQQPMPGLIWDGEDIVSPHRLEVVERKTAAEAERIRLQQRHTKVYVYEPSVSAALSTQTERLSKLARSASSHTTAAVSIAQASAELRREALTNLGIEMAPDTAAHLLASAQDDRLWIDLNTLLQNILSRGVVKRRKIEGAWRSGRLALERAPGADADGTTIALGTVLSFPADAFRTIENVLIPEYRVAPARALTYLDLARQLLRPNVVFDPVAAASRLRCGDRGRDQPDFERGQVILAHGDTATSLQTAAIGQLAIETRGFDYLRQLGAAASVALVATFVFLYARRFLPYLSFSARSVLLVAMPVALAVCLGRLAHNMGADPLLGAYAFPAGMVGMLGVVLRS